MVSTIISLSSSFSSIHIRKYCLSDRVLVMMKCGSRVNSTIKDDCYSPLPFQHNHSPLETLSFLDTVIRALCVVSPTSLTSLYPSPLLASLPLPDESPWRSSGFYSQAFFSLHTVSLSRRNICPHGFSDLNFALWVRVPSWKHLHIN